MAMDKNNFYKALDIISSHHSSEIIINQPINNFVGDLGSSEFTIHIKKCVPSVINKLIQDGFMLDMGEHGLSVTKL